MPAQANICTTSITRTGAKQDYRYQRQHRQNQRRSAPGRRLFDHPTARCIFERGDRDVPWHPANPKCPRRPARSTLPWNNRNNSVPPTLPRRHFGWNRSGRSTGMILRPDRFAIGLNPPRPRPCGRVENPVGYHCPMSARIPPPSDGPGTHTS